MHNVYLFQPQYTIEYRKENNYWLPYSAACVWSYAAQFDDIKENFNLKELFFRRDPPTQVLERLENPRVAGFSCYVWNEKYCLTMAQLIKQRWPNCAILFGGPQANGAMLKHQFVDSIIMGEGEESFLEILRAISAEKPIEQIYKKQRLENLNIPSPYTTGLFDQIIKDNPGAKWSTTVETNRGCPFACTFCDWGSATYSKIKKYDLEHIQQDIEWCAANPISYLFVADANFGVFKERDIEIAQMIRDAADRSMIDSVNVQYAKNSSEVVFTIAQILGDLSRGVTVSVQSMNDSTLDAIKRKNLDVNNIKQLMELSEKYNVATYTEVILGLPLETMHSWKQGFDSILEMGQHNSIDMWFAQLLTNSELSLPNSRRQYGIKSIVARDYMPLVDHAESGMIEEHIELINQTSTMSTQELVECYMYGWMVIHFHVSGYSQMFAKYCRNRKGVPYRQFYDQLFVLLQQHNFFQEHFNKIHAATDHYMRTGDMIQLDNFTGGGHTIHSLSYEFIYNHKQHAFALAQQVAEHFVQLEPGVAELQTNFIFDQDQSFPVTCQLDFDLDTWQDAVCSYEITPKINTSQEFDFYRYRRQSLIKNKIKRVI